MAIRAFRFDLRNEDTMWIFQHVNILPVPHLSIHLPIDRSSQVPKAHRHNGEKPGFFLQTRGLFEKPVFYPRVTT